MLCRLIGVRRKIHFLFPLRRKAEIGNWSFEARESEIFYEESNLRVEKEWKIDKKRRKVEINH